MWFFRSEIASTVNSFVVTNRNLRGAKYKRSGFYLDNTHESTCLDPDVSISSNKGGLACV